MVVVMKPGTSQEAIAALVLDLEKQKRECIILGETFSLGQVSPNPFKNRLKQIKP